MLGAPVVINPDRYNLARSVVAGRCINAFSHKRLGPQPKLPRPLGAPLLTLSH